MGMDVKRQGAHFWDQAPCGGTWSSYEEFADWIRRTEPYIFEVLDRYEWEGRKVLDVGCGQGTTLTYLPKFGATVYGLDLSFQSLKRSLEGGKSLSCGDRIHVLQADAESLPFPDDCFDAALSVGVLHHTQDTEHGIWEIHRVLKPDGRAIVMLYRSGNPKWWSACLLRRLNRAAERRRCRDHAFIDSLRSRREINANEGTALLELFGVPILKAFTNREALSMFRPFRAARIRNYQPGFRRLADVIPQLKAVSPLLARIDKTFAHSLGFYQVIEARK